MASSNLSIKFTVDTSACAASIEKLRKSLELHRPDDIGVWWSEVGGITYRDESHAVLTDNVCFYRLTVGEARDALGLGESVTEVVSNVQIAPERPLRGSTPPSNACRAAGGSALPWAPSPVTPDVGGSVSGSALPWGPYGWVLPNIPPKPVEIQRNWKAKMRAWKDAHREPK